MRFKLGVIVNPLAGLGGSVALKGSDNMARESLAKGAIPKANERCLIALEVLKDMDIGSLQMRIGIPWISQMYVCLYCPV